MAECPTDLPNESAFASGLEQALNDSGALRGKVRILDREPNTSRSTVPCEKVTCQDEQGQTLRVFCKFGMAQEEDVPNHRLGVAYEATVYRHVLRYCHSAVPRYCGEFIDPQTGVICLVLGCVEGVTPMIYTTNPAVTLGHAATWLAKFHAEHEGVAYSKFSSHLALYDAAYYRGWAQRVCDFSSPLHAQYPWLPELCRQAPDYFAHLINAPLTVIHGECYATNWLISPDGVVSIDWESCALAAGAIDVASLGWGWGEEAGQACAKAYATTRGNGEANANFPQQLLAARLYLALRWLGDCPEWTTASDPPVSFEELKQIGIETGLVS